MYCKKNAGEEVFMKDDEKNTELLDKLLEFFYLENGKLFWKYLDNVSTGFIAGPEFEKELIEFKFNQLQKGDENDERDV